MKMTMREKAVRMKIWESRTKQRERIMRMEFLSLWSKLVTTRKRYKSKKKTIERKRVTKSTIIQIPTKKKIVEATMMIQM